MFDKNFYPTPPEVIQQMLNGVGFNEKTKILEPSAGKGDILDYVFQSILRGTWRNDDAAFQAKVKRNLFCIEQNPQLQAILKTAGYSLIDSDFLAHANERQYDLIVMNPPFDTGSKHLLKALEIAPYADIRCLLNAETLNNLCTKEREVLQYKLSQRDYDVKSLGAAFSTAERKTNVDVALVRVAAEKRQNQFSFRFEPKATGEKLHTVDELANNQLESRDVFGSLVHRYNKVKELGAQVKSLQAEMKFYANGLTTRDSFIEELTKTDYPTFVDELRKRSWDNIYSQTKLANFVTSQVQEQIEKEQSGSSVVAFTEENIYNLLATLSGSLSEIRKTCIQNCFDLLTRYHKKNRVHVEGWKTNEAYKVSRKCILPNSSEAKYTSGYRIHYSRMRDIRDIEKALCLMIGLKFSEIKNQLLCSDDLVIEESGVWFDTYFFRCKVFKKGTLHIEFRDKKIWERFNLEAAAGRNWLPGDFEGAAA